MSEVPQTPGARAARGPGTVPRPRVAALLSAAWQRRGTLVVIDTQAAHQFRPLFTSVRAAQNELLSHYTKTELELLADYFTRSAAMFETERTRLSLD